MRYFTRCPPLTEKTTQTEKTARTEKIPETRTPGRRELPHCRSRVPTEPRDREPDRRARQIPRPVPVAPARWARKVREAAQERGRRARAPPESAAIWPERIRRDTRD